MANKLRFKLCVAAVLTTCAGCDVANPVCASTAPAVAADGKVPAAAWMTAAWCADKCCVAEGKFGVDAELLNPKPPREAAAIANPAAIVCPGPVAAGAAAAATPAAAVVPGGAGFSTGHTEHTAAAILALRLANCKWCFDMRYR